MTKPDSKNNENVCSIILDKQKMAIDAKLIVAGANDTVLKLIEREDLAEELALTDLL